jgi:PPOX class probable F420-dependent enzyme
VPVTIPPSHADLLERPLLCTLATVKPNGQPQSNPMWFQWDGKAVRFTHTSTRAKYRNLQREPRAAVSVFDPDNPYRYLELRGRVTSIEPNPDGSFYFTLAQRYGLDTGGITAEAIDAEHRVVLVFEPEAVATK